MIRIKVDHEVALPYARRVLEDGRAMARIVRETVDLDQGSFEATADFKVFGPHSWEITTKGSGTEPSRRRVQGGRMGIGLRSGAS
jgi:hypothetical protein